jgi:hypothetical protein
MFVVWKRPDGFHGAEPKDFKVVEVGEKVRLWLHKKDADWFPFRISGGWQEQEATQRLNRLVNLIGKPNSQWVKRLVYEFHHSMTDDGATFFQETMVWLDQLVKAPKGDTWEIEIMVNAIQDVQNRVKNSRATFLLKAK